MLLSAGCGATGQVGDSAASVSAQEQPAAASAVTETAALPEPKSYDVGAGPDWDDATAYSCLQACALLFGGTIDDWACSTSPIEVNHVAWYSKFGSAEACGPTGTPLPEDYNPGGSYEESEASAYVNDWCFPGEGSVNYCHTTLVVVPPPPPPPPPPAPPAPPPLQAIDAGGGEGLDECESSDDEPVTIKGHVHRPHHLPAHCRDPHLGVRLPPAHAGRH
jgi:hypothetical protein